MCAVQGSALQRKEAGLRACSPAAGVRPGSVSSPIISTRVEHERGGVVVSLAEVGWARLCASWGWYLASF